MEKRINILFDHLNNEDLLRPDTVQQMVELSQAVSGKEWDRANAMFVQMQEAKMETEGTHWMVSCHVRGDVEGENANVCRRLVLSALLLLGGRRSHRVLCWFRRRRGVLCGHSERSFSRCTILSSVPKSLLLSKLSVPDFSTGCCAIT